MTINDLADGLAVELPGCPLPTIRDMLRWAQRELCAEGNVWVSRDGPVVVAANTGHAEVEAPQGAEALRLMGLFVGARRLKPGLDYRQLGPFVVALARPAEQSSLLGELACRPLPGLDMPAELLARWSEALLDGARYKLLTLPQPWRDLAAAGFHRRRFIEAQTDARALAHDGMQAGSVRMRVRRFI